MVRALGSLARGNLGLVRITTALKAEKSATLGANSGIGAPSSGGLTGRLQTQAKKLQSPSLSNVAQGVTNQSPTGQRRER